MAVVLAAPDLVRVRQEADPPVRDAVVSRSFTASAPNRLWLTDITEHRPAILALFSVGDDTAAHGVESSNREPSGRIGVSLASRVITAE